MLGRLKAFSHTFAGLTTAWKSEEAFRMECILGAVLFPAALWLGDSGVERAVLILPMALVLIVELLNSAVETAIDRIGPEHHPLSKQAKDLGSAAVFLSLIGFLVTWAVVLL